MNVTTPDTDHKEQLLLNYFVEVTIEDAEEWCLGYLLLIHSSQGLTIKNP